MNFLKSLFLLSILFMITLSDQAAYAAFKPVESSLQTPLKPNHMPEMRRLSIFKTLSEGVSIIDLNEDLFRAVKNKDHDQLIQLLSSGAPVNMLNTKGYSALHYAAFYGDIKSVEILLGYGFNKFIQSSNDRPPREMLWHKDRPLKYYNEAIDEELLELLGGPVPISNTAKNFRRSRYSSDPFQIKLDPTRCYDPILPFWSLPEGTSLDDTIKSEADEI